MTLNPVGAPACVRCNTPLPGSTGDPTALPRGQRDPTPAAGDQRDPAAVPRLGPAGPAPPASPGFAAGPGFRPPAPPAPPATPPATPPHPPPAQPPSASAPAAPTGPPPPAGRWTGPSVPPGAGGPTATGRLGPGLATPPRAAPGSSRAAAAPVQPPGYGLADPPPPARPAPPDPAELRRARRRIAIAGVVTSLLVVGVGGAALWLTRPRYLDTGAVGRAVGAELSTRLGDRVLVRCDGSPRRRAGETFRCTATDGAGTRRTVTVTLLDDAGRYRWQLGP
jgi:hypothetical protein